MVNMENARWLVGMAMGLAMAGTSGAYALPLTMAFTYQGRLVDGGLPGDGVYDFRFRLYDAAAGGNAVGGLIAIDDMDVIDGLFTVALDFGPVFQGDALWMEIEVRAGKSGGGYTVLGPRTELTAAPYALFSNAPWVTVSPNIHYSAGNVGIGDSTPVATLTVGANDKFQVSGAQGDVTFTDDMASITFPAADAANAPMMHMFSSGTTNGDRMVLAHSPLFPTWGLQYQDAGDRFNFLNGGNPVLTVDLLNQRVGIGTSTPASRLHVTSSSTRAGYFEITSTTTANNVLHAVANGDNTAVYGEAHGDGLAGEFVADNAAGFGIGVSGTSNGTGLLSAGVQAIGTNTAFGLRAGATAGTAVYASLAGASGTGRAGWFVISNPNHATNAVQIDTNGSADSQAICARHSGLGDCGLFIIDNPNNAGECIEAISSGSGNCIEAVNSGSGRAGVFVNTDTSNSNSALYVRTDGSGPAINCEGTCRVDVLEIDAGSDLSETFNVTGGDIQPGTVVVINPERAGELMLADRAYDRRVAGIVSGAGGVNTGMLMGQKGSIADGSHPIALTGRVYCHVDATEHAVEPGDLLTTSTTPGHAMKVSDHGRAPGAVIGKAMTGLAEGQRGLVLVLVNLQ